MGMLGKDLLDIFRPRTHRSGHAATREPGGGAERGEAEGLPFSGAARRRIPREGLRSFAALRMTGGALRMTGERSGGTA